MTKFITYAIAAISYLAVVVILFVKLGGGMTFLGLALEMGIPYGICASFAGGFRKHRVESLIILVGTAVCAYLGLEGVYSAFFTNSPHDPWKALMPMLYQFGVIIIFAVLLGCAVVVRKRRKSAAGTNQAEI